MDKSRLNLEIESVEFNYLKMLCAKKGITITSFLKDIIKKAISEEEDVFLAEKAAYRLHNLKEEDLIPIEQAFEEAGWNNELSSTDKQTVRKRPKTHRASYASAYTKRTPTSKRKSKT